MGTIVYYMSKHTTMSSEKAIELGLGYAMDGAGPCYATMHPGPDGGRGAVFTFAENLNVSNSTVWQEHPDIDGLWVGYDPNNRPGPDDLIRSAPKDGHYVKLCDGNDWLIPVARAVDGTSPLPRKLKRENGKWAFGDVEAAFKDYFAEACKLWDALGPKVEGEKKDTSVTIANAIDVCVMALSINYRVGVEEIVLLGLLNTDNYFTVCEMILDMPAVEELVKKNERAEAQSSKPGAED